MGIKNFSSSSSSITARYDAEIRNRGKKRGRRGEGGRDRRTSAPSHFLPPPPPPSGANGIEADSAGGEGGKKGERERRRPKKPLLVRGRTAGRKSGFLSGPLLYTFYIVPYGEQSPQQTTGCLPRHPADSYYCPFFFHSSYLFGFFDRDSKRRKISTLGHSRISALAATSYVPLTSKVPSSAPPWLFNLAPSSASLPLSCDLTRFLPRSYMQGGVFSGAIERERDLQYERHVGRGRPCVSVMSVPQKSPLRCKERCTRVKVWSCTTRILFPLFGGSGERYPFLVPRDLDSDTVPSSP